MPAIPIDKAEPGMVVTEQVMNDKGMVLLPPNTTLSEVLIARLKKWNVQTVVCQNVAGMAESSSESKEIFSAPVIDAELEHRMDERFKSVIDDPIMADILKGIKAYYNSLNEARQEKKV